uniref:Uncharacterized protein n=1 Tax=Glossina brevipalpis TaxID=37001 RepID=A0A1A9WYY0_9MUSC
MKCFVNIKERETFYSNLKQISIAYMSHETRNVQFLPTQAALSLTTITSAHNRRAAKLCLAKQCREQEKEKEKKSRCVTRYLQFAALHLLLLSVVVI